MPIPIGTRLGVYEIRELLGVGGMGEVYRAHDTKLNREVALKVLPPAFARDPERIIRFRREAQLLAQLNHPNIAAIYNFEETPEARFLVMELVLGETLREKIKRGALPMEEVLKIGTQIAEALEHAHEKPIIHRDLKPANVKVTPQGQVKVLDFGLAKAFGGDKAAIDPHDLPTGSQHGTLAGTILGTPAYMSPEQAGGKTVDKRTDIWALGCVLYELLTGQWAFQSRDREGAVVPADTVQEIIARVLKAEPDWTALPEATPPHLRSFLRRCLEKDAKRRFRDAADIAIQLEEAKAASASQPVLTIAAKLPARPRWRRAMPFVLTGLVVATIATGLAVWRLKPTAAPTRASTAHFVISLPPGQELADLGLGTVMALSPDGTRLAYVARSGNAPSQIYIRTIDSPEARPLPSTEGARNPFFSPDGQWLGFFAPDKLQKVSLSGGTPVTIFDAKGQMGAGGATWGTDDTIVFQRSGVGDLWRVPAAGGGEPQRLQNTLSLQKGLVASAWPAFLPGANDVVFAAADNAANWYNPQLGIYRLKTGERRDLPQGGTFPRYSPTGHLLYVQNGTLMAAPFDPRRLELTGAQVPVVEGVMQLRSGAAQYSFSDNGTLVYVQGFVAATGAGTGTALSSQTFVWVDRKGTEQPIPAPPHAYRSPRLSPDGRRLAVAVDEPNSQIWIYDIPREALTRLTFEGSRNNSPVWTPDGKRVTFGSGSPTNLFWQPADGSGKAERLATSQNPQSALSWSPDGQSLVFRVQTGNACNDLWVMRLSDSGTPGRKEEPFLQTPFCESAARFSPDGRWLAYLTNESGRDEIYVQPFPGPGGKWQISTEGGVEAVWNPNGRELFFRNGNKMMAVDITTQPTFSAGKPRMLFEGAYQLSATSTASYDVSPDGQRFLMLKGGQQQQVATQIHVVLNWFEELKKRVPAGR